MLIGKVACALCGRKFKAITHTHLVKEHDMTMRQYMDQFPEAPLYEEVSEGPADGKELLLDALSRHWDK